MTKSKEITPHIIWKALLFVAALGVLCLALFGCNSVKRVLKDTAKMEQVFNEGVKKGWCVNDTIIQSKSDTLITFDTLFAVDFETDTFTVDREVVKTVTKVVTKTVKIRDTVTNIVKDNRLINLLGDELSDKQAQLTEKENELKKVQAQVKEFKQARNKWRLYFWLLVAAIGVFLFGKPLLIVGRKLIGLPF